MEQLELSQVKESLADVKNACSKSLRLNRALAGLKRQELLQALRLKDGMKMKDLASVLNVTSSTTSRHVKELKDCGLVNSYREGKNTIVILGKMGSG